MVRLLPHAPGYTISTDAFMDESQLVGFHVATQSHVFMHFHEFYELALVTHGTGLHMAGESEQRISRGSVIFIVPGVSHGFRAGKGLVVLNCMQTGGLTSRDRDGSVDSATSLRRAA